MAFPLLIVQTPRAGRLGYVNLLPTGELPTGFCPGDYLDAASHRQVGGNFLAVAHDVEQADTGRTGKEILALVGVRVPTEPERQALLLRWLESKLPDVTRLVTETIQWEEQRGDDVPCTELNDCMNEAKTLFTLTPHKSPLTPQLPPGISPPSQWSFRPSWMRAWLRNNPAVSVFALLLVVLDLAVAIWLVRRWNTTGDISAINVTLVVLATCCLWPALKPK